MNQANLETVVQEQSRQIRILQEQMRFALNEIHNTQNQTNQAIRHFVNIVRDLRGF